MTTPTVPAQARGAKGKADQPEPAGPGRVWVWSWRHGPVIGTANAASGILAAGMVGDLAAVSPWWGAAAAGAGAAGITARAVSRRVSPLGIAYRAACMVGAGSWLSWAWATSPWAPDTLAGLAIGAGLAGLAAPELADHDRRVNGRRSAADARAAADQAAAVAGGERVELAVEWVDRLTRVCAMPGAIVLGVEEWPGRVGYTLEVRLPGGAPTWQQLAKHADRLAADANLAHGCTVEFGPGVTKGVCLINVAIVDTTAEPVPYPDDYSLLTINGPLPVGMHRAAVPATVELLDDPMVAVGRRGSGKTVFLQVVNLGLARCPDVVIWHIDLNGAGMSRPWIRAWLEGRAEQPVVDWVAADVNEAIRMVRTAIEIGKGRKGAYQDLMRSVDDDKIPVSPRVPAIIIVVDEGAEAVAANRGNRELAVLLETAVATLRAARIQVELTGVRATADIIPVPIQSQAGVKIWMRPEDQHEVAQLLGWHSGVSIEDAPYPGSGLMRKPGAGGIRPFRGHIVRPTQIDDAAVRLAGVRPALDTVSARLGGDVYARRWDRYHQSMSDQLGGDMSTTPTPPPAVPEPGPSGLDQLAAAAGNLDESLAKLRELRERKTQGPAEPDFESAFAQIVEGYQHGDPVPTGPAGIEVMHRLLANAGPDGMHYETLHARLKDAGVQVSQATLFRWLKSAETVEGRPGVHRYIPPAP